MLSSNVSGRVKRPCGISAVHRPICGEEMYVNGQHIAITEGMPLLRFLQTEGYDTERVAVERNGKIVKRTAFKTEALYDDDKLEIVCFVGGG